MVGEVFAKGTFDLALGSAVLLAFGLAGQLGTSVIPLASSSNTTASEQDTIMVVVGFTLAAFAALHYWLPKITGRLVAEGPAKAASALILGGAITFAFAMFFAGLQGQPVDVFRYYEDTGLSTLNLIGSAGAFLLVIGVLIELGNLAASYSGGRPAGHDPWHGSTLEWFALSPPPPHNFDAVPDVRSPSRCATSARRSANEAAYVPPVPLEPAAPRHAGAGRRPARILRSSGSRRASAREPPISAFRRLVTTIVATFVLILIGGIVRASRFYRLRPGGLGHHGWPLCEGGVLPAASAESAIEYSHRITAGIVSILMLMTAWHAWRHLVRHRWLVGAWPPASWSWPRLGLAA